MKHAGPIAPATAVTIFALSSGAGRAAIAVIRLSGPATRDVVRALCGRVPPPRRATLVRLRSPIDQDVLDQSIVLWLPGPGSFTGEDCAEFHTHGGRAVVDGVLDVLSRLESCRAAEPGEFTRRAFLNGRMDLTAVEGLADLIDAETRAQRRQALRQLDGPLGARAEAWRAMLLRASALVEASLDFSDEGDVADSALGDIQTILRPVHTEIADLLATEAMGGVRLREGFTVVVAGPPNVGKSTLMNALARRDAAIVSPHAGTTRDAIEAHLDLGGLPVVIVDTAGIRETQDPVEREGVERARRRASQADLILWLDLAGTAPATPPIKTGDVATICIATQVDRSRSRAAPEDHIAISALTGEGMGVLLERIRATAAQSFVGAETSVLTRVRHRRALQGAVEALSRSLECDASTGLELVAEDIRLAADGLGRLSGRIGVEEILGEIFARFCVGK